MRIGIATWTRRLAGGVETYLGALVPALLERGHEVSVLHEVDEPSDRAPITTAVPHWQAGAGLTDAALAEFDAWKPDVVFTQGLRDPLLDARVATIAPTVLFAHDYRGTCVSGTKSFAALSHATCQRRLGWQCLAHYFPNRCGGLNPLTMAKLYRRESQRRDLFKQYVAVVMFSEYMRREFIRNGVAPACTHRLPGHLPFQLSTGPVASSPALPSRLLFIGRMEELKGGHVLLDALPIVQQSLGRALHVSFVGDGRLRRQWEAQARRVFTPDELSRVEFTGWVGPEERTRLLANADLIVVPSLWPEPFGLIGLEAAACGVPAAAFDVGGISEWLDDGINGHLAPANPPRAPHLAAAIIKCLRDPSIHQRLSRGAREMASRHSIGAHVAALLNVFTLATSSASNVHTGDPAA